MDIPQNFAIWNNVSMKDGGWHRWRIKRSYKKLARTPAKVNLERPERQRGGVHQVPQVRPEVPAGDRHPHRAREV